MKDGVRRVKRVVERGCLQAGSQSGSEEELTHSVDSTAKSSSGVLCCAVLCCSTLAEYVCERVVLG